MPHVLFVCTGNICRSAFAERLATHLSGGAVLYASAGIAALAGEPMDPLMAAELASRGASADGFTARQLTSAMLREADLVVCAEARHRLWVVEEFPAALKRTTLLTHLSVVAENVDAPDPFDAIKSVVSQPLPSGVRDIPDPYRQGAEAAAEAAASISEHVRTVVSVLER